MYIDKKLFFASDVTQYDLAKITSSCHKFPVAYDYGHQKCQHFSLALTVSVKWPTKYNITKLESPVAVDWNRRISIFTTNLKMDIQEITLA